MRSSAKCITPKPPRVKSGRLWFIGSVLCLLFPPV
uniref:Uncharacterized protein n=1 Tax=Myoviridae sp. ctD8022 TaxID=2825056 RepID=A0A8S5P456_9CAUD|nr:MAG TPA: hypothetical protein [Myoviridae sp. ctD8022]DAV79496.1 MAG TPA: hypothetical protein [Caudoviricetes sp.]